MCGGVEYVQDGARIRAFFPTPYARLPVIKRDGSLEYITWGRRKNQLGKLPMGGWARLESIHEGVWDRWTPRSVKIVVDRFMEKDIEGNSHWFEMTRGTCLQGLLIYTRQEMRVYVVTISPEDEQAVHDRWPRVINGIIHYD